jgi:hypothetical protein
LSGADKMASKAKAIARKGYVGMQVTKRSPFIVLEVSNLMDEHYTPQGHAGYSNEIVKPGDKLLRVDGRGIESATLKQLHALLDGEMHSLSELSFLRGQGGEEYTIQVRRHGRNENECKPANSNVIAVKQESMDEMSTPRPGMSYESNRSSDSSWAMYVCGSLHVSNSLEFLGNIDWKDATDSNKKEEERRAKRTEERVELEDDSAEKREDEDVQVVEKVLMEEVLVVHTKNYESMSSKDFVAHDDSVKSSKGSIKNSEQEHNHVIAEVFDKFASDDSLHACFYEQFETMKPLTPQKRVDLARQHDWLLQKARREKMREQELEDADFKILDLGLRHVLTYDLTKVARSVVITTEETNQEEMQKKDNTQGNTTRQIPGLFRNRVYSQDYRPHCALETKWKIKETIHEKRQKQDKTQPKTTRQIPSLFRNRVYSQKYRPHHALVPTQQAGLDWLNPVVWQRAIEGRETCSMHDINKACLSACEATGLQVMEATDYLASSINQMSLDLSSAIPSRVALLVEDLFDKKCNPTPARDLRPDRDSGGGIRCSEKHSSIRETPPANSCENVLSTRNTIVQQSRKKEAEAYKAFRAKFVVFPEGGLQVAATICSPRMRAVKYKTESLREEDNGIALSHLLQIDKVNTAYNTSLGNRDGTDMTVSIRDAPEQSELMDTAEPSRPAEKNAIDEQIAWLETWARAPY